MNYKKILIGFLIILIIVGAAIRFIPISNDFSAEETEFVRPGLAIAETGHPIFYQSEQTPNHVALWHPPMYIFLLAGVYKFAIGEAATRSVNVIFSLLTALLIFLFCTKLVGGERGKLIGFISSALFLTNFYVLSSSLLVDIDALSMFFVFGFVFSMLMYYKNQENYVLFLAGVCLLCGLANRYPIMILTYFFVGVYYFFNRDLKKDFNKYILVGLSGAIVFLLIWGVYSIFIEPGNFLFFLTHNFKMGGEQVSSLAVYLGSLALNISQFVRLFTLPATILMIWSFFYFYKDESKLTKVLLLSVLPVFLFFLFLPRPAFGYTRYFMTIFPGVFLLIGIFLYKNLRKVEWERKDFWMMAFAFIFSLILLIILAPQTTIYASNGLIKATNFPDFVFNLLCSIPLVFVFIFRPEERRKMLILMLIALMLSYGVYFNYGYLNHEPHIKEAAQYLHENTFEGEVIMVPKAIGHYAGRGFYINDNNKPKLDFSSSHLEKYFSLSLENPNMDDGFFWPEGIYSGLYYEASEEELDRIAYVVRYNKFEDIEPEIKIGDFYVYNVR